MSSGNAELLQIIRQEIQERGPMSCERFIELALYHPRFGYYSADRIRIGRRGDFITNVSIGDVFGSILAGQIAELWEMIGRPPEFTLIEPGAETGDLAADVLKSLSRGWPSTRWNYVILEPNPAKQEQQKRRLVGGSVNWVGDWKELDPIAGVILCNELLDALPPRVVELSDNRWREVCVVERRESLEFSLEPIRDPRLAAMVAKLPSLPFEPYRTEINLATQDWIRAAGKSLSRGFLLLIDYGYARAEYFSPLRTEGTLSAYREHRRQKTILAGIGETDITAHVDFTSIAEAAAESDCEPIGFTDQHHFMVGAGESRLKSIEASESGTPSSQDQKFLRAYKTLMHPETMGLAFKYLLFGKGVSACAAPSGFRYAHDPKKTLGLEDAF